MTLKVNRQMVSTFRILREEVERMIKIIVIIKIILELIIALHM